MEIRGICPTVTIEKKEKKKRKEKGVFPSLQQSSWDEPDDNIQIYVHIISKLHAGRKSPPDVSPQRLHLDSVMM